MRREGPVWISHRGYHKKFPENSAGAFDLSVEMGFDWLETDLRCSVDGVVVLSHDSSLERVAGVSHHVENLTWQEICCIELPEGQRIMSLKEYLERYSNVPSIFDVKPESAIRVIKALADIEGFDELAPNHRFLFWSRAHEALFREANPNCETLARQGECLSVGIRALMRLPLWGCKSGRTYSLPARFLGKSCFHERFVDAYRQRNARVLAFLPERHEAEVALEAGFDEILTNYEILP